MGARQKVRKASDSSLYREIELLMIWLIGVGDRIPKGSPTLLITAKTLMETLADALTSCGGAYLTPDLTLRRDYLSALQLDMTVVQSIVKVWFEWSSQHGQTVRLVSREQHAHFLRSMTKIGMEMTGWRISTEKAIANRDK